GGAGPARRRSSTSADPGSGSARRDELLQPRREPIRAAAGEALHRLVVHVDHVERQHVHLGQPRIRALERHEPGLVEQELAEAHVAPAIVAREQLAQLVDPLRARRAVALAEHQDGQRRGHEGLPRRAVEHLETVAHAANGWPFLQSAPHRPPLCSACSVRSVSPGLRPAERSLTLIERMMPLSSTITVARKAMPWSSFSTPNARDTAWF